MKNISNYESDRRFTDLVHKNLACKIIYPKLNWDIQNLNSNMLKNIDINNAVDYIAFDRNNEKIVTIQERFRENQYSRYSDFTIRYKREHNKHEERKLSEYFKLDVDYLVYGIIDESKIRVTEAKNFLKYCVIDINKLKEYIDLGKIIIKENTNLKGCTINDEKLICPVIQNNDFSSSFFPVNIPLLSKYFNSAIIIQYGFNNK